MRAWRFCGYLALAVLALTAFRSFNQRMQLGGLQAWKVPQSSLVPAVSTAGGWPAHGLAKHSAALAVPVCTIIPS